MQVHDVVTVMDEGLRAAACQVATALRQDGHTVDVVLEAKKMKQVFKVSTTEGSAATSTHPKLQLRIVTEIGCATLPVAR